MDIGRREGGGGELYSGYREKGRRRRRALQWILGEGEEEEENFTVDIGRRGGGGGELYRGYREKGRRRRRTLQRI